MRTRCEDKEKRADMKEACFESKVGSMYACIVGVSQGGRGGRADEDGRRRGSEVHAESTRILCVCVCPLSRSALPSPSLHHSRMSP